MGLASKLQAAQQIAGPMMQQMAGPPAGGAAAPGGMPAAPYPGAAPPYPPAAAPYPGTAPNPYPGSSPYPGAGQPSAPPSPYPPNAFGAPPPANAFGAPPPAAAAGAGAPYQPQQQQQPSPYPAFAQQPPGQQVQQQGRHVMVQSPYPAMPGAPGQQQQIAPGGLPPFPQQQQGQLPAYPGAPQPQPQQQMMGGPGPAAAAPGAAGGAPGGMAGVILAKLTSIVQTNGLQRFYSPQALQALAPRLDSRVNFREVAARWQMPVELALDLAGLALYDTVIMVDDSGSMAFEEQGERIEDLKLIGSKVAEIATMFDDDGILMRFMNSPTEGNGLRSPQDVANLLANVQYSGLTPLATSLQAKVLQPIVYALAGSGQLQKPVLVITITDGEPTDNPRDLVVQVIKEARHRLAAQGYGPKAVAFEFAQVGKDQRAQAFLARLDQDPEVGSSIDCTSYYELESAEYSRRGVQLSPSMWLVKMMVGSIDPSYDEGDE